MAEKDVYNIDNYIRETKICGVCGELITAQYRVNKCSEECDKVAQNLFLTHDEMGNRPIWMILDIMQTNGLTWREYAKDRNGWHLRTYGR